MKNKLDSLFFTHKFVPERHKFDYGRRETTFVAFSSPFRRIRSGMEIIMWEKGHSESKEDYLEGIYIVNQRKGACRSVDLADELGYSKASVSVAIAKLGRENLVRVNDSGILELTQEGKEIAVNTFQKHVLLKKLLCGIGVDERQADIEACRIEHIISDDTFNKLIEATKDGADEI